MFLLSTHDALIYDEGVRLEFAEIVRYAYSIYRKLKVRTTYRAQEVEVLKEKFQSLQEKMAAMFSIPINTDADVRCLNEYTETNRRKHREVNTNSSLGTQKRNQSKLGPLVTSLNALDDGKEEENATVARSGKYGD